MPCKKVDEAATRSKDRMQVLVEKKVPTKKVGLDRKRERRSGLIDSIRISNGLFQPREALLKTTTIEQDLPLSLVTVSL